MTPGTIIAGFMLGTARQLVRLEGPIADGIAATDPDAALRLLALAGQALRFERPIAPARFDVPAPVADPRRIVSPRARRLLRRLVTGKGAPVDDAAARAAAQAMARLRLRPHPFDLPRLGGFVRKFGEVLGPAALAWGQRGEAGAATGGAGYFEADELGPDSWTLATPARKAGYIAVQRATDPAGARALVEAQLPVERADVRVRLIEALAIGLGPDDRRLLESLEGDRAPRVKEAAERLLARLPGTVAAAARVGEIVSRIATGKAGLLRRRTTLALQLPANIRDHQAPPWVAGLFSTVGLGQIAAALGLDPSDMIDAAKEDRNLLLGLAFAATVERRFDMLRAICVQHVPDAWSYFLARGLDAFGLVGTDDRMAWAAAALPPAAWPSLAGSWQAETLHEQLDGPLPVEAARGLIDSGLWSQGGMGDWVAPIAALVPIALLPALRARLATLPAEVSGRALLLADLLVELDDPATEPATEDVRA